MASGFKNMSLNARYSMEIVTTCSGLSTEVVFTGTIDVEKTLGTPDLKQDELP